MSKMFAKLLSNSHKNTRLKITKLNFLFKLNCQRKKKKSTKHKTKANNIKDIEKIA